MNIEEQLQRLRAEWLKASPEKRKIIEMKAKILKMRPVGEKSTLEIALDIFGKNETDIHTF